MRSKKNGHPNRKALFGPFSRIRQNAKFYYVKVAIALHYRPITCDLRQINEKFERLAVALMATSDFLDEKYEFAAFLMVGEQGIAGLFGKCLKVING